MNRNETFGGRGLLQDDSAPIHRALEVTERIDDLHTDSGVTSYSKQRSPLREYLWEELKT